VSGSGTNGTEAHVDEVVPGETGRSEDTTEARLGAQRLQRGGGVTRVEEAQNDKAVGVDVINEDGAQRTVEWVPLLLDGRRMLAGECGQRTVKMCERSSSVVETGILPTQT
jgi:hypothetical protein